MKRNNKAKIGEGTQEMHWQWMGEKLQKL